MDKGSVYGNLINAKKLAPVKVEALVRNASLQSRLGGEDAVAFMYRIFYGKALRDARLKKYFDYSDAQEVDAMLAKQLAFVNAVLGGTSGVADVRGVYGHLAALGLTGEQFDAVVDNVTATMRGQNVPHPLIDEVTALIESVRKFVVG